jgi:flavin reductase (DIM6/NTAB) family NADH-FMN oxidoreductase RutF
MKKVTLGPLPLLYPMPAALIGANVREKPNFMTAAYCGIVAAAPPTIAVGIRGERYTLKGIHQNDAFSVNVPSASLAAQTDYCGIVSGATVDKAADCGFTVFYGKLKGVPLIEQCPINLECKLIRSIDLGSHTLLIGQIEEVHVTEECMSAEGPDPVKVDPLMYAAGAGKSYFRLGEKVGSAFNIGRQIKETQK